MTRREMREHCFKMLFGVSFYPAEEADRQAELYFYAPDEEDTAPDGQNEILHRVGMTEEDRSFLLQRVSTIAGKVPELDGCLDAVAQGWTTRRMGRVELTILRQALYEMRWDEDVPEKVAINEAVDLAKKFGGKDSAAFINGVLAKLVKAE